MISLKCQKVRLAPPLWHIKGEHIGAETINGHQHGEIILNVLKSQKSLYMRDHDSIYYKISYEFLTFLYNIYTKVSEFSFKLKLKRKIGIVKMPFFEFLMTFLHIKDIMTNTRSFIKMKADDNYPGRPPQPIPGRGLM